MCRSAHTLMSDFEVAAGGAQGEARARHRDTFPELIEARNLIAQRIPRVFSSFQKKHLHKCKRTSTV